MKALMKSKIKLLFSLSLFFIALTGFVFTSCENSIHNDSETEKETAAEETVESKNSESGLIKIVVDNFQNDARTVLPDIATANIVSLSLIGTQGSNTKNLGSWTSLTSMTSDSIELKTGSWSLTLTALLNNGVTFTATTPVTVTGTGTQTVNFSLSTTATKGGVYLKVSYTGTAQAASYQLYQWSDGVQGASINSGDLTLNTTDHEVVYERPATGSTALASGNYRIKINFWGDELKTVFLNSYSEIIRINGGYTSKAADRQIELNSMYTITYMNGGTTPATLAGTPASSLVEKYSARSAPITLPEMTRDGYVFDGWYTTSACTGTALSTFAITSSTSLGPKTFYAKYRKICDLTYIISSSEDAEINLADLTAAQKTTYGIPDLPATHTEGETTDLPVLSFTDGVSATSPELFDGYHYTTLTGSTGPTLTGSGASQKYVIGASDLSDNATIYIKVNPINSYVDPNAESDTVLAFNVSTPAKTVSAAKGWLKDADSTKNPVLYAKGTLNTSADINALTNLTTETYGNAIYKRHSSQNGSPLFLLNNITATIENLTIDGGAVWQDILTGSALAATSNVSSGTNAGLQADQPIILITGSGATLNMSSVHVQNCDGHTSSNNCKNIYVASGCILDIRNSSIKRCKADMGGAVWAEGKIIAMSLTMSYNYSLTNGGAAYIGNSSTVNVKFQNSTFDSNCAGSKGGAIYNTAVSNNNVLLVKDTFMGNTSSFANGTNIYNAGKLKLSDQMILIDGDIYVENTNSSTQYPIIIASDFSANGPTSALPMTIKPAYYYSGPESAKVYDRKVFDFSEFSTNTTLINTILGYFELEDDAYQINTSGIITPIPGTVTVTPGFPGNYVCQWKQSLSGSTRTINIIVKDSSDHRLEVGTTAGTLNNVSVGIYEGADCVKDETGLSFTYPAYLDPPSGTPFYVRFDVQVDATTAYSYDYWPEQVFIGSKAPDQAKNVGDIVFNDGSAEPYVEGMTISDEQKSAAIALIFYKGTGCNDEGDPTIRTLGVGLKHSAGLAWCLDSANAFNTNITTIQCPANGSAGALTFTGDKNGSNNLEQIATYLAHHSSTDDTSPATKYPAFYFAKNYKEEKIGSETVSRIIEESEFKTGWYLPSNAELFQIYACRVDSTNGFDIDTASVALGGDSFGNKTYWSSSQYAPYDSNAYLLYFNNGDWSFNRKDKYNYYVCAIRAF